MHGKRVERRIKGRTNCQYLGKLMKMYKSRGMVESKRYQMCIGSSEENVHEAIILEPSTKDT